LTDMHCVLCDISLYAVRVPEKLVQCTPSWYR